MTFDQQNGFNRQPLRNMSPTFEPQYGDPKKMGIFGAPACRCTSLVLALCLALCGLVVCGIGGVIAGFMWADETPKGLGFALVALGILMMIGGFALYMWDNYNLGPGAQYRSNSNFSNIQQTQVVNTIPSTSQQIISSANTQLNRQALSHEQTAIQRGAEAPPPYDDIMNTSVEYRKPLVNAANGVRPSYQSAVSTSRVTSTTAV